MKIVLKQRKKLKETEHGLRPCTMESKGLSFIFSIFLDKP